MITIITITLIIFVFCGVFNVLLIIECLFGGYIICLSSVVILYKLIYYIIISINQSIDHYECYKILKDLKMNKELI